MSRETESLSHLLAAKSADNAWQKPQIFSLSEASDRSRLEELLKSGAVRAVHDHISYAIEELCDISQPAQKDSKTPEDVAAFARSIGAAKYETYGVWVYYPWSGQLVHMPEKNALRQLRTSRNRNLVNAAEQTALYSATILVVGLSVGSSAVEMLVSQGIGGRFVLADMDIIEPSNLNRIKLPYAEVGVHKVDAMAKKISETDPYIEQIHYKDGLTEKNLARIMNEHRPDVIIDEMDSLSMKITLRKAAKENGVAVLMATDDGDNAILDIERYDQNPDQELFDGRIPSEILEKILSGAFSRPEIGRVIGEYFVGFEHVPLRMLESLAEVGKTLPSWPQLAGAATLSGVGLAYAAKKIILDYPLHAGRHIFDIDAELNPEVKTEEYQVKMRQFFERGARD